MKRLSILIAFVLILGISAGAFAKEKPRHYEAELKTLNDSGVSGRAELTLDGDQLTVKITASGFEPNQPHPQHIHGLAGNRNNFCPPTSADTNGDGIIDIGEGLPYYGPVLIPLTPFSTTPDGTLNFEATFTVDPLPTPDNVPPFQNRAIVLHGLTVGGSYVASTPVACGTIHVDTD